MFKICKKCGKKKPRTAQFFNKAVGCGDGLRGTCKECQREYHAEYRKTNAQAVSERKKKCYQSKKQEYLDKIRRYYQENINTITLYQQSYREDNKPRLNDYNRKYYLNNHDALKAKSRKYHHDNSDDIKVKHSRWAELNSDKVYLLRHRRRARFKDLPHTLNKEQWAKSKEYFENKCAYCGKPVELLVQDHFIALTKGGEYTHNNIIPACQNCNSSKYNNDFFEWYPNYKHYSLKRKKKILKYLSYTENIQQLMLMV